MALKSFCENAINQRCRMIGCRSVLRTYGVFVHYVELSEIRTSLYRKAAMFFTAVRTIRIKGNKWISNDFTANSRMTYLQYTTVRKMTVKDKNELHLVASLADAVPAIIKLSITKLI